MTMREIKKMHQKALRIDKQMKRMAREIEAARGTLEGDGGMMTVSIGDEKDRAMIESEIRDAILKYVLSLEW